MPKLRIDLVVLFITILLGFITNNRKRDNYQKIFPYFLVLILSVEFVGALFQRKNQNNLLLFNLFTVVEFSFYALFFRKIMPAKATKKIINWVLFTIPLASLINIFLIQGPTVFHTYTYSIGSLTLAVLGLTYFFQLFKDKDRGNSFRDPSFWISVGILFYSICSISIIGILNYISFFSKSIRSNMQHILVGINTIFYLILIIAFLCKITHRKYFSRH